MKERGQAHTLEAFTAAMLVLGGVAFALQATAVTPLSASTSNQHIENQHQELASNVLTTTAANGSLERAVALTNGTKTFHDPPPNDFGYALSTAFSSRTIAYNVIVQYRRADGKPLEPVRMVYMGAPSDNAVTASYHLSLYDDTVVPGTGETVKNRYGPYPFAKDSDTDGPLFNVVEVRIVVWRI
jgi:hypothetical protein